MTTRARCGQKTTATGGTDVVTPTGVAVDTRNALGPSESSRSVETARRLTDDFDPGSVWKGVKKKSAQDHVGEPRPARPQGRQGTEQERLARARCSKPRRTEMTRVAFAVVLALLSGVTRATAQESRVAGARAGKGRQGRGSSPLHAEQGREDLHWAVIRSCWRLRGSAAHHQHPEGRQRLHGGGVASGAMYRSVGDQVGSSRGCLPPLPTRRPVRGALQLAGGRLACAPAPVDQRRADSLLRRRHGIVARRSDDFGVDIGRRRPASRQSAARFVLGDPAALKTSRRARQRLGASIEARFSAASAPGLGRRQGICTPARSRASTGVRWRVGPTGRPVVGMPGMVACTR